MCQIGTVCQVIVTCLSQSNPYARQEPAKILKETNHATPASGKGRPHHRRRAVMTAALRIWTEIIAAVALLFWMNVWFGIAATGIVVTVVFILPAWLASSGFRGS